MKALASTASILFAIAIFVVLKGQRLFPENLAFAPFQSAPPGFMGVLSNSLRRSFSQIMAYPVRSIF